MLQFVLSIFALNITFQASKIYPAQAQTKLWIASIVHDLLLNKSLDVNICSCINQKRTKIILCFSDKSKLVEFITAYCYFQLVKKTCSRIKCVLRYYSEAENLVICSQMQEGENPVNKDHYSGYTGRPSLGFGFQSNYLSSMSKVCKPALLDGLRYSSSSMKARQLWKRGDWRENMWLGLLFVSLFTLSISWCEAWL